MFRFSSQNPLKPSMVLGQTMARLGAITLKIGENHTDTPWSLVFLSIAGAVMGGKWLESVLDWILQKPTPTDI